MNKSAPTILIDRHSLEGYRTPPREIFDVPENKAFSEASSIWDGLKKSASELTKAPWSQRLRRTAAPPILSPELVRLRVEEDIITPDEQMALFKKKRKEICDFMQKVNDLTEQEQDAAITQINAGAMSKTLRTNLLSYLVAEKQTLLVQLLSHQCRRPSDKLLDQLLSPADFNNGQLEKIFGTSRAVGPPGSAFMRNERAMQWEVKGETAGARRAAIEALARFLVQWRKTNGLETNDLLRSHLGKTQAHRVLTALTPSCANDVSASVELAKQFGFSKSAMLATWTAPENTACLTVMTAKRIFTEDPGEAHRTPTARLHTLQAVCEQLGACDPTMLTLPKNLFSLPLSKKDVNEWRSALATYFSVVTQLAPLLQTEGEGSKALWRSIKELPYVPLFDCLPTFQRTKPGYRQLLGDKGSRIKAARKAALKQLKHLRSVPV